jgi:hypothetical protein
VALNPPLEIEQIAKFLSELLAGIHEAQPGEALYHAPEDIPLAAWNKVVRLGDAWLIAQTSFLYTLPLFQARYSSGGVILSDNDKLFRAVQIYDAGIRLLIQLDLQQKNKRVTVCGKRVRIRK